MRAVTIKQIVRCPACGAVNRIAAEQLEQGFAAVCGKCKSPLPASTLPVTVTDANFSDDDERAERRGVGDHN